MNRSLNCSLCCVLLLVAACGPAEDVNVQQLPSLTRSSPEARAGLPEIRGAWRFAGWELAEGDSAGLEADLPALGILWLQTQKRDSLAGQYVAPGGRVPLFGEVRRDSVVALVAFPGPQDGRFLAGRVRSDTIWVAATSLLEPGSWPDEARAAFVRSRVASAPFARLRGAMPAPVQVDSSLLAGPVTPDTMAPAPVTPAPATGAAVATPAPPVNRPPPAATATPRPQPERPAGQPERPTQQPPSAEARPAPQPQERPPVTPPREPRVERPEPRIPPLLGEPVVRDTTDGNRSLPF